jgi:hypothetical protein
MISPGMKTSSLDLLERSQLSPAQARAILQAVEAEFTERDSTLATRLDLLALKGDLLAARNELQGEIRDVEHRLEIKIETLRGEIQGSEARLIRWNFAFWVAQLAAVAALLKLVR